MEWPNVAWDTLGLLMQEGNPKLLLQPFPSAKQDQALSEPYWHPQPLVEVTSAGLETTGLVQALCLLS